MLPFLRISALLPLLLIPRLLSAQVDSTANIPESAPADSVPAAASVASPPTDTAPVHDSSLAAPVPVAKPRNVDSTLERSSWLKIRSRYSASVILDEVPAGDLVPDDSGLGMQPVCIWRSGSLAPGAHKVRVEADLCTPWETVVDLPAGRATSVDAPIDWTPEEKRRRHQARLRGPRIVLGIGAALSGVFALSSSSTLQSAKDQRAAAQADYNAANITQDLYDSRISKAKSDIDSARNGITWGAVLGAICIVGFGATWVF
jgi:hypothetical protein